MKIGDKLYSYQCYIKNNVPNNQGYVVFENIITSEDDEYYYGTRNERNFKFNKKYVDNYLNESELLITGGHWIWFYSSRKLPRFIVKSIIYNKIKKGMLDNNR